LFTHALANIKICSNLVASVMVALLCELYGYPSVSYGAFLV